MPAPGHTVTNGSPSPKTYERAILYLDEGFNGHGEHVECVFVATSGRRIRRDARRLARNLLIVLSQTRAIPARRAGGRRLPTMEAD